MPSQDDLMKRRTQTVNKEQLHHDVERPEQYEDKSNDKTVTLQKKKDPQPAPGASQLTEKKLTDKDLDDLIRAALADNPPSRMQINHLVFQVPPEQITVQHEVKNVAMGVLRASSTQKVRTGHSFIQVSFPLVFVSRAAVNKELVPLLYMLRKTPFCWVHNEYLRKVLMPENTTDAMMLTLQAINVQSVPNLPTTFQAVLQFLWFNYKPYTKALLYRKFYDLDERMEPEAFGPEAYINMERVFEDVLGPFAVSNYIERNRFKEHLDAIRAEPDPDKQRRLYDYLQQTVTNPAQSLPWYKFVAGAEQNELTGENEYGPSIAPDQYFRLAWKEWRSPGKAPVDKTWTLEDQNYNIYSKIRNFNSNSQFLPVHVNVQFAHRIASLPLLSHQLPTHQYLGPTDRMFTATFHVTKAGKKILERFQKEIEDFQKNVLEYRTLAHNAWMEIKSPLLKASHFPAGRYGYKVVPEHIDIETVPGSPAASIVRVTFSEFNPSVFKEQESPVDREDKVITSFIQGVFNRLSGGKPTDILYIKTNAKSDETDIALGGGGGWGEDVSHGINEVTRKAREDWHLPTSWTEPKVWNDQPWMELHLSMTESQANIKGMAALYGCAEELAKTTHRGAGNLVSNISGAGATGFAYATDEECYGLKSLAEISLYWGGDSLDVEAISRNSRQLKDDLRTVALKWLRGRLRSKFPSLSIELKNVNLDLNSCYPDMDLPPHPVTGRVIDTEPDFYHMDLELLSEADSKAKTFAQQDIMPAIKQLVKTNAQTALDINKEAVDIVEKEKEVYSQQEITNMDDCPNLDKKKYKIEGDLKPSNVDIIGKLQSNITEDEIFEAGVSSIRRDTKLGMKKAYPTFRLYFVKESHDEVTYTNFYEAQGGFAVKGFTVVRSRNIPADMCVIQMVNLDGFIETNVVNDIRNDAYDSEQTRYIADNELFDKHEQVIKNQLQIANSGHGANIKYDTIKNIVDQVNADPPPGGVGPMGVTNVHAEIADGKTYSSSTLASAVTNIRIGTNVVCQYAAEMKRYENEPRFEELVAALYRYPQYKAEITKAAEENYNSNGVLTSDWAQSVRSTSLKNYVESFRPQGSAEATVRKDAYDKEIKETQKALDSSLKELDRLDRVQGVTPTPLPERIHQRQIREQEQKAKALDEKLTQLKREKEATAVRDDKTDSIIFKEGTDVVLKLGYSNNPENLEIVFVGEVTEVSPGAGMLEIIAQSYATELMQDIKGVPEGDAILKGDVDATKVSNWLLSYPEVKHFGRWEDAWEIVEDQRNIRGRWYKRWNWTNNPSDDNVYLENEFVGEHSINGRTLWQGLQDLCFYYPGFVMGVRPYRDLDRNGRRRWRNTLFIGKPDTEYLWWVPDDWSVLLKDVQDLRAKAELFAGTLEGTEIPVDIDLRDLNKMNNNLEAREKWLQALRRERFRRYHFLSSYHNIIDNGIILTKRDVYNGIRISARRKKGGLANPAKDEYEDIVERQLDGMDPENINWLYVENDNAWGSSAQKMATSILLWQLRDIYQGEITILGDPNIRPFDVCFINDIYNDITGPIEVGQVVHTFTEETGFITQIKPDLFTSIGEMAQRTAMGAMAAYSYRWLMNRMGIGWYDEIDSPLSEAYKEANQTVRTTYKVLGVLSIAGLAAIYPLFMAPILLGGYFLGNYIRKHATIRVVPLMHKGYPFVTGLEGFKAPDSSNVLLNQFRILKRGITEGVDAVGELFNDVLDSKRRRIVFRRMFGL